MNRLTTWCGIHRSLRPWLVSHSFGTTSLALLSHYPTPAHLAALNEAEAEAFYQAALVAIKYGGAYHYRWARRRRI